MRVIAAGDSAELASLFPSGWSAPEAVVASVAATIADVRARGDAAVADAVRRFDAAGFEPEQLRVSIPPLDGAGGLVPRDVADAMRVAAQRIARFHERQRASDLTFAEEDGSRYAVHRRPLDAIAGYVPATSPLALLMSAIPAKLAGVRRVVAMTPPQRDGVPHPAVLFACALCGVDELYAAGGAAAIAAAAYGTESLAAVEKIVGPGGVWVTEAKRQVFGRCGIDALCGPAEVLVVADDGANSEYVLGELLAQAEHAAVGRLAVVSESRALLDAVAQLVDTLDVKTLERGEAIDAALDAKCRLVHAANREEVFAVIERFAPALLCLQVRDASLYLPRIRCAGTVFVGDATPLACGDYLAGTNAVVPTAGTARFSSGLSLRDFTRTVAVVENSLERMMNDAAGIAALAEMEGLPHHAQTARMRFGG